MTPKTLIVAALALVFGAASTMAVLIALRPETQTTTDVKTVTILTAKDVIHQNSLISEEDLIETEFPEKYIDLMPTVIRDREATVGKRATVGLLPGEPITADKLGEGNPSGDIPEGKVAISMTATSPQESGGGLIQSGDFVDVLLSVAKAEELGANTLALPLLRRVRVFAIGDIRGDAETDELANARSVTLEVTPEQAQQLTLTEGLGRYTLIGLSPTEAASQNPEEDYVSALQLRELEILEDVKDAYESRRGELFSQKELIAQRLAKELEAQWDEEYFGGEEVVSSEQPLQLDEPKGGIIVTYGGVRPVGYQRVRE